MRLLAACSEYRAFLAKQRLTVEVEARLKVGLSAPGAGRSS